MDNKKMDERARRNLENGAVVESYKADKKRVLQLLDEALATELVCVLRYKRHYETAQGLEAESIIEEFLEHAHEEQEHADLLAKRISQLNGEPDYNPETLAARSHTKYVECDTLLEMIRENLVAERIAIESYGAAIREIGDSDPTTRRVFESILEQEEEHADDMVKLLHYSDSRGLMEPPKTHSKIHKESVRVAV